MLKLNKFFIVVGCFALASCMSDSQLKDKMTKVLKENPQIVIDSIKENPADYIMAIQDAAKNAQGELAKKREEAEQKKLEATYDNPLTPEIRSDESFRGPKDAPLLLLNTLILSAHFVREDLILLWS